MEQLRVHNKAVTLVDQVEDKLLSFLREQDLRIGDTIPSELELAATLGVARSVLREALSRLRMMGMIETRTRRGTILTEPSILKGVERAADPRIMSESSLYDILGLRIALEIGTCSDLFMNITPRDIEELGEIVLTGTALKNNEYTPVSEFSFHSKLYEITGNRTILQFQEIIHPVTTFVKSKFKEFIEPINIEMMQRGELVTHADLLEYIKRGDEAGYRNALERHFSVYKTFIKNQKCASAVQQKHTQTYT